MRLDTEVRGCCVLVNTAMAEAPSSGGGAAQHQQALTRFSDLLRGSPTVRVDRGVSPFEHNSFASNLW
jgi:hypothetical protein